MMWVLFLLALKSSYWYFDIRSSEIFIPQYLWPFQDWEGIILINAIILILKLLFTYVAFSRSIYNSKVIYRHQCNFSWSNQIIITRTTGDICYSFMDMWVHLMFLRKCCQDLLNDAEESMMEYKTSIAKLKKESKYTLDKVVIGESDLRRGQTDLRCFTCLYLCFIE